MSDIAVVSDEPPSCYGKQGLPSSRSWPSVYQSTWWWPTLWFIILALSLVWRTQNIDAFGLLNDEGAHLMWAKLSVNGYPLYSETRAVQSPLFLETIGLAFHTLGESVTAGRFTTLAGFGLLSLSLSYLAYQGSGWLSALIALLLLSCSPLTFTLSRAVMAEVPATAWAVTSLALLCPLLTITHRPLRVALLLASGMAFGLSLLTKALNPFVAGVALLFLRQILRASKTQFQLNYSEIEKGCDEKDLTGLGLKDLTGFRNLSGLNTRMILLYLLGWVVGCLIPLIITGLLYPLDALYENLLLFRGQLRATEAASVTDTLHQFQTFFWTHWGVWLLTTAAVLGRYFVSPDKFEKPIRTVTVPNIVWLMVGVLTLAFHKPLFPHHFIILLPPMILLAAETITQAITSLQQWPTVRRSQIAMLGCTLLACINLPSMVQANQQTTTITTGGREAEAITFLQAVSQPTDFVMGDSQLLIFMADRQTPPPLGDVALVGIKAGLQTSARMIDLTERYHAPAVVQWSLRLPWLPDYLAWVEANYLAKRVWDNDHIIYFAPRLPTDYPIPNATPIVLDEQVRLRGHAIDRSSVKTDSTLHLTLYWQPSQPLTETYTVFTQLLDPHGQLVASWDSQPLSGHFPTTAWPAHETIRDRINLPLPNDLLPNDYTLITGMYQLDSMTRLRQPDGSDYVTLARLTLP